nr:RNA-directed DNA polymerase, eukaryota, reverse transcriptase zinc-binding domain protein [Tanacetum cinerariifolium]
ASGLSINFSKSKFMGLAVSIEKVKKVMRHIGCGILNTSFSFLGSKVGGCMSRIKSSDEVIDKMVSWNKVLKSKDKGGLGVSSLFVLNRVLMFKWVWRFFNQSDSLWVRVIHAIHGVDGRIGRAGNVGYTSIWCDIIKEMDRLASHGIDLISIMHKKIGNGLNTSFLEDRWRGEQRLKEAFLCIYALEVNKHISVAFKFEQTSLSSSLRRMPRSGIKSEQWDHLLDSLEGVMLNSSEDRWSWDLNGSEEFSVASARRYIDNNRLSDISSKTRWIKEVPIKVNVHAWKVHINGLPTRWNISCRGIDIPSILCPLYETGVESSKHLFFNCSVVRAIFRRVCIWWDGQPVGGKFINELFPPSRTTNLRNEISNFQQRFDESFHEAWDRYKDLFRACPYHGLTELHQLDTFYNALNPADQDSLNAAAGGNLLERRTQDIAKLTHAVNQQTSVVTTAMTAILKKFQATPPPAFVKDVEEICVTCGGAHPYYQYLVVGRNTFRELRDNIQGYVSAATVNYNQGSGSLPSNTVANPKGELKPITTQSSLVVDGPTVPTPYLFINLEEDEHVEETLMDSDLSDYTIKVPPPPVQKYKPPSRREYIVYQRNPLHPNIPYPSRMLKQKQQEKDEVQIYKFWQMFKQLHVNITLVDALILIPKYQKMLKALFSNKEKLQEPENTPLNENYLAYHLFFFTNPLLEEFTDELALITFPLKYDDDLQFDVESDLKEIEFLLHQDIGSSLKDSIDQNNLANLADNFVDSMLEMFTDIHVPDYSSPSIFDEDDDDFLEVESDTENVYDDPFASKGEKIKESKLLIDDLDLPYDFLPLSEYDSFISQDFSRVNAKPTTNNEDKVFNPSILIHEKYFQIITRIVQDKKVAKSNASLVLEDLDPLFYEPPFFRDVPSIPRNLKTRAEGFCPPVFIFSASLGNHISKSNRANVYLMAYLINGLRFM